MGRTRLTRFFLITAGLLLGVYCRGPSRRLEDSLCGIAEVFRQAVCANAAHLVICGTRVLKELSSSLSLPLSLIFRKSLESGILPKQWKEATVTPIFKKGSRRDTGNCRPISLTSVPGKITESLIRDAVLENLLGNRLLTDAHYGFLPKKSCDAPLLTCMEDWTNMLEVWN